MERLRETGKRGKQQAWSSESVALQFWGARFHLVLQKGCRYTWASPRGQYALAWRL